ncbi:MAG: META domain-containing protein [Salinisphaera sp.]|jgi:copper homeostasis protein (lipoprotein)|nr:META domain-containing protein [Salinisphaera sp.]
MSLPIVFYRSLPLWALGLVLLIFAGCAHRPGEQVDQLGPLPAAYAGTLPCTHCAGADYRLILGGDQSYVLSQHYHAAPRSADVVEVGRWRTLSEPARLVLTPTDADDAGQSLWRLDGHDGLTALGANGQPVGSGSTYQLNRLAESDGLSLAGPRWTLVNAPETSLPQPVYIRFDDQTGRISGSTGCNRLMGAYRQHGDKLSVSGIATTRMACAGHDDTQQSMLDALKRTIRIETLGRYLLLYGDEGNPAPLAVFHAGTHGT